jgi:hypothetical protein
MLVDVIVSLIKFILRGRERMIYHLQNVAILTRADRECPELWAVKALQPLCPQEGSQ